jgi:cystathionine beta-lyase family protein involved in aluminum resistance
MPTYTCNHCKEVIKNNGGNAREIGMFWVGKVTYCRDCAKTITAELLNEL